MKDLFSIAATAALMLGGASAAATEPSWEVVGFPITPHQVAVLGSVLRAAQLQERAPTPTLALAGVPASPHQVAVLTPRPRMTKQQIAEDLIKAGFSQVRFDTSE